MDPEKIAAFFVRRGTHIIKTRSCWWYNEYHQRWIYYSFPLHRLVSPTPEEIAQVFRDAPKAIGIRFISPPKENGMKSFIWVCRSPYELTTLSSNIRHNVRRGLKHCQIRPISFPDIVEMGGEAHRNTLRRHGESAKALGLDEGLSECPAYEAWGAFVDDHLVAYLVTLQVEDWIHFVVKRSMDDYHKFYPNNALVFKIVQELLSRPGVSTVSQGLEPLASNETLDYSKSSMGFQKEPVRQRIIIRPSLRFLVNKHTCRLAVKVLSPFPLNYRLQQLLGLCRIVAES